MKTAAKGTLLSQRPQFKILTQWEMVSGGHQGPDCWRLECIDIDRCNYDKCKCIDTTYYR